MRRVDQPNRTPGTDLVPYEPHYPVRQVQQAPIIIQTGGNRRGGMGWKGGLFCVGAVAAAGVFIADKIGMIEFGWPNIDLRAGPPTVMASVDQRSYELEVEFDLSCNQRVSVAVDVEAHDHQVGGSGNVHKKMFGDFLLCSDDREIETNAVATQDPISGEVTSVIVELSGVYVEQPRVHHLDPRNCIDGNIGDTMEEIDAKLAEYLEDVANGETPECDSGWDSSGLITFEIGPEAKDMANKAAQLAITVDANPAQIIETANAQLDEAVTAQLQSRAEFANANIDVRIIPRNATQTVQDRINSISAELQQGFTEVRAGTDENGSYLYLEDASGATSTVYFTGQAELEADLLQVENLVISENSGFTLPTTGEN